MSKKYWKHVSIGAFGMLLVGLNFAADNDPGGYFATTKKLPLFREINDKLTLIKEIVSDTCYDRTASPAFTTQTYSIASGDQRWITDWGCTNTNGSLSNLVSGYVQVRNHSGFLSNAKIMVVALDQDGDRINTDEDVSGKVVTSWCMHFVDSDTSDDVTIASSIDVDASGASETSLPRIFKSSDCGTLS